MSATNDPAHRLLAALIGPWCLDRDIGPHGILTGRATFTAQTDDRALYEEAGELALPGGQILAATRRYVWSVTGPQEMAIRFAGGHDGDGLLYPLSLIETADGWRAEATHRCAPDTYRATLILRGAAGFDWDQAVTGPRKDYRSISRYRP